MIKILKTITCLIPLAISVLFILIRSSQDPNILGAINAAFYVTVFILSLIVLLVLLSIVLLGIYKASLIVLNKNSVFKENGSKDTLK